MNACCCTRLPPSRRDVSCWSASARAATAGLEQLRQAAGTAAGLFKGKRLADLTCALPLLDLPRIPSVGAG